ncbi:MAG TPA: protease complex subunit PrcB family protein [Thioalkalivibrio sp.]|nr:protease complex subunit PrcB family protein [Thioalkalivibrio sp.]
MRHPINVMRALLGLGSLFIVTGCTNMPSTDITVLHRATHCASTEAQPSATWVGDGDTLTATHARLTGQQLGARPPLPAVDFEQAGVLLLEMGQRPTGGYAVALAEPVIAVDDGIATVTVNWQEPAPGAIATQALTSPCLLLEIPRGDYTSIRVVDQDGRLRLEIPVTP